MTTTIRCSDLSASLYEPLAGTTAQASTWLCIEQPGPWGTNALQDSRLDPEIANELTKRTQGTGTRVVLIRRPGQRSDAARHGRKVYVASTWPGAMWGMQLTVSKPDELLDWDFGTEGPRPLDGGADPLQHPLLLVCTNGRRDSCCAIRGRPIGMRLARRFPEAVWESSHIGGHRFSPTILVLPSGYSYGRVNESKCEQILASAMADRVVLESCRGRSTWSPPGQMAELTMRRYLADYEVRSMHLEQTFRESDDIWFVRLHDRQHGTWKVRLHERRLAPARPGSCCTPGQEQTLLTPSQFVPIDVGQLHGRCLPAVRESDVGIQETGVH